RGERLAGGPEIDHVVWFERLQGADWRAVIAQLGVVVVLDDVGRVGTCPSDRRAAPLGPQLNAEWEGMGGREGDGADGELVEKIGACAEFVDRERDDLEAGVCDHPAVQGQAGVFDRNATDTS